METAVLLLRGFSLPALPVLRDQKLVGMLFAHQILGAQASTVIAELMSIDVPAVDANCSVREAAQTLAGSEFVALPVMDHDHVIGVLRGIDLLADLGRSFDPLTELSWSDNLRDWAIGQLRSGHEITVLFIDLDDFGQFNKKHGHIVGDAVLQSVSRILSRVVDADTDVLCRYGGDEFCIASLRSSVEARELGDLIEASVSEISLADIGKGLVRCTVGMWGGKRSREREHVHYAATLNSLINLASRDCTARKGREGGENATGDFGAPLERKPSRIRLCRVDVRWSGRLARVHVDLQVGDGGMPEKAGTLAEQVLLEGLTHYTASATAATDEDGVLRLIAETTVTALRGVLPVGSDVYLSDLLLTRTGGGQQVVTAIGEWACNDKRTRIAGSTASADDLYRAAAMAVLAAVNRPIGLVLDSE